MHFAGFSSGRGRCRTSDDEFTHDVEYEVWRRGGNPDAVSPDQVKQLRETYQDDDPPRLARRFLRKAAEGGAA